MPSNAIQRLRLAVILIVLIIITGTIGYHRLEEMSLLNGLYMTIITLSTVGFGEIEPLSEIGRLFTIMLILAGVGVGAWAIESAVEVVLGDQLWSTIGRRRMERAIEKLTSHYIVCGFGRMGRQTVSEFRRRKVPFVVVESDPDLVHQLLEEEDILVVEGDATYDETLLSAGIERARGLVAVVDTDADNVLITLTAKELNPDIIVVARAALEESESKLYRAGADRVVTPYAIGGRRIALAVLRPTVTDFLSTVVFSEEQDTEMGELHVHASSPFAGKTVKDAELRNRWGATIIGIKKPTGKLVISPTAQHRLEEGDVLIIVAETPRLRELEKL